MGEAKKLLSVKELVAQGYSREELYALTRIRGQTYARKTLGGGKWLFDPIKLEHWRESHCK